MAHTTSYLTLIKGGIVMATRKTKKFGRNSQELLLTQEEGSKMDLMESIYNNVPTCGGHRLRVEDDAWQPLFYGENDRTVSLDKLFR